MLPVLALRPVAGDQLYEVTLPVAVSVAVLPPQIVAEFTFIVGVNTVTVAVAGAALHPLSLPLSV